MKKNKAKILILFLCLFLLTGCAKTLVDENKKIVTYDSSIICDNCTCANIEDEKEKTTCESNCKAKCDNAKENQTGQRLTKNILCKPTNSDVIEIYKKYKVDIDSLPSCTDFKLVSEYEGLWVSLFVKPLAWLILKLGSVLNNYGLSLVIISILIRVVLMPMTKKTAMQSENLKKAEPELNRINKKYEGKTDQESQLQKSQDTMMVYKKYGINPMSSCLFALIQIPLLFAFIEAINRTPAIFEGKFLGLHLGITPGMAITSGKWYYIILVIILGLVTHYSLSLNRGAGAPGADNGKQMEMMNLFMLVLIVVTSFGLSTAICIYWISSSLCTVVQNILVKREK